MLGEIKKGQEMEQPEKQPSKLKGRKLEPKYRDPETGKTWAGRGRLPKWMVWDKEAYRINAAAAVISENRVASIQEIYERVEGDK